MGEPDASGALLDRAQDKVAVVDDEGVFRYVNAAAERILGYRPAELLGENAFEYVHPDDRADLEDVFARTITADGYEELTATYRYRTAEGDYVWFESRLSNVPTDEIDGYVVSSRDVTDRVEAEREREETADRLDTISATSPDVLWMFGPEWQELYFINEAVEETYGVSRAALAEDPVAFLEVIHPDDVEGVLDAMERLSAGESVEIEYRVNPAENYGRWVWVRAEPVREAGEVVGIVGFSRDVTDRRRRERHLVVMDNLLRHNLRNDLNVVLGAVDTMEAEGDLESELSETVRETAHSLLRSADKERRIIDLLTASPADEPVPLAEAVDGAVEDATARVPEAAVSVRGASTVEDEVPAQLRSALVELIENAARHAPADGATVSVEVSRVGEELEVAVSDEAEPIPEMEASVLRGEHDAGPVRHSSGLGLWLVYWCVELANGQVRVDREPGGNTVRVRVPPLSAEERAGRASGTAVGSPGYLP